MPRITIIMPSLDQAPYLEEAICSVLDQRYPNLELIVLDAGSTDGSKAVIEKYSSYLAYWRSELDDGQSAAIDEGMSRGTGDLAGWLNSDDALLPGALQSVARAYVENPQGGLFGGNLLFMNQEGRVTGFLRMPAQAAWFARHGIYAVSQPGSFFRPADYFAVGGIRHDLHYVMDNELYLRILLEGVQFIYVDRYLAAFRRHALQKTTANKARVGEEVIRLKAELRRRGLSYRSPQAVLIYRMWQTMNGNYLKKRLDIRAAAGKYWQDWAQHVFRVAR